MTDPGFEGTIPVKGGRTVRIAWPDGTDADDVAFVVACLILYRDYLKEKEGGGSGPGPDDRPETRGAVGSDERRGGPAADPDHGKEPM